MLSIQSVYNSFHQLEEGEEKKSKESNGELMPHFAQLGG